MGWLPSGQARLIVGLDPDLVLLDCSQATPSESPEFRQLLKRTVKERLVLIMGRAEQTLHQEARDLEINIS
jgi:hypothetical protein